MTAPQPKTGEAIDFLQRYAGNDPVVLTSISPEKKGTETITLRPESDAVQLRNWIDVRQGRENVYFTVNPAVRELTVKASKADIRGMRALHVDVDPRPGEDFVKERERILKEIEAFIPAPTIIIDSGGGYQGFWVLDREEPAGGSEERIAELEAYNQQIVALLHADPCHNIDRIMRVPGTLNVPDAKKLKKGRSIAPAKLVRYDDALVYPLTAFTPAPRLQTKLGTGGNGAAVKLSGNLQKIDLEALPEHVSGKAKEVIVHGEDPDNPTRFPSRSEAVFYVCCELARASIADDVIAAILMDRDFRISDSILENRRPLDYAARQIQRAKEDVESGDLRELNDRHAVISDIGGQCRIISEVWDPTLKRDRISKQSFEDFRNRYMNRAVTEGKKEVPLGQWWLKHPMRRQYDTIVFAPGSMPEGAYNLWRGFACEAIPGDWSLLRKHVLDNICSGDREHFDYVMGWMARAVQQPDSPGEVAIVLRGRMGTGKGVFIRSFGSLWGRHFLHVSDPKHLTGSFNAHLRDCVVLFGDESFYAGDKKHESILKTLITEETIIVEGKGVNAEAAPNYLHLLLASNAQWVVPAGSDERRYFTMDVGDGVMQDPGYFKALSDQFESGGREAMLHDLLTLDLSGFEVRRFPKTDALQEQKLMSWSPEENWWYEKIAAGWLFEESALWETECVKADLDRDYLSWATRHRVPRPLTTTMLGRFLLRAVPNLRTFQRMTDVVTYDDDREGSVQKRKAYWYGIGSLAEVREHWDRNWGGPWKWND